MPRTASCCSSEPFPSLLGTAPLCGHAAAQRTVRGGVAMWLSSGQGEVEDTSEKAPRRRGWAVITLPGSPGPPVCREDQPPSWSPCPIPAHSPRHARSSGLTAHTQGLQGPDTNWTHVSGSDSFLRHLDLSMGMWLNSLGGLHNYGRICLIAFADVSFMAHLSPTPPQGVTCLRLRHTRQETRGKRKLRGMLKIIDRGFHDSALLLHLLVSCEMS